MTLESDKERHTGKESVNILAEIYGPNPIDRCHARHIFEQQLFAPNGGFNLLIDKTTQMVAGLQLRFRRLIWLTAPKRLVGVTPMTADNTMFRDLRSRISRVRFPFVRSMSHLVH